jgi:carbon monoxide dehydrogenase subunit G
VAWGLLYMPVMPSVSAFGVVAVLGVAAAAPARADAVSLTEKSDHTTEGVVTVDAPPDQVYAAATDYANWEALFSDVKSVKVESGGRENARVWFDSRAIRKRVLVQFKNVPGQAIRFVGVEGPKGGRAHGTYRFDPIDGGTRTRVTADLYLEVTGPVSWFVSDSKLRTMRRNKVRADLTDVARHFAHSVSSRSPARAAPPPVPAAHG